MVRGCLTAYIQPIKFAGYNVIISLVSIKQPAKPCPVFYYYTEHAQFCTCAFCRHVSKQPIFNREKMKIPTLCCVATQLILWLFRYAYSQGSVSRCSPIFLPHGRVISYHDANRENTAFARVTYVCNEGFVPRVPTTASCSRDSVWTPSQETLCKIGKLVYHAAH